MARAGSAGHGLKVLSELVGVTVAALLAAFLLKTFLVQAFFIPSASMAPQLAVGDRVLVAKLAYDLHEIRRGDIIVFQQATDSSGRERSAFEWVGNELRELVGLARPAEDDLIKRVIGLPGEKVEARNGQVFVNGLLLVEPYLPEGTTTAEFSSPVIPPEEVWVMGDNRGGSSDSRSFGPVPMSSVLGRAVLKVWPPFDASFL